MNHFLLLYFVIIIRVVFGTPLIFDQNYQTCVYNFKDESLIVPGKLWKISSANFTLQYSLCGNRTSFIRNHHTNITTNLGDRFIPVNNNSDLHIETINGENCSDKPRIRYQLIVNFICRNNIRLEPQLIKSSNCIYVIEMIRSDCRLKCTGLIDDRYLIDLRQFPKNLILTTPKNQTFSLTICGTNHHCSNIIDNNQLSDISSCALLNNTIIPLADIDSQSINYDVDKGELTVRGRYKSRKITRDIQILFKCNWDDIVANIEYIQPPIQGKHYKFELESSYGCIKLPQKCLLTSLDGLKYDLQQLYQRNNYWLVRNTLNNTKIILNLCGPLEFDRKNQCSDQYSQICKINNGKYTNLGSLTTFNIESYGIIRAVINNGGRCNDSLKLNYKTEIKLICSPIEQEPILNNSTINCTIFIIWYTPLACPQKFYQGDNCLVHDPYSPRNLQNLHQQIDKIHKLNSSDYIVYNLCGPLLQQTCANYTNVSFCLYRKNNGKQYVLGWDQRRLISDYGQLRLELDGDLCPNQYDYGRIIIHFICDYNEQPPKIDIIQDCCKFNLTIYTRLACLSDRHFEKCNLTTTNNNGDSYDLSKLILKNRNYIINDIDDNNLVYSLNLCGPIITNQLALCKGNTMLCMFNRSELNLKQQFKSLGSVIGPQFVNNSLIIETLGDYHPHYGYYKSRIQFQCSNFDELPKLLQKKETYLFIWRTPYACPKQQCKIPNTTVSLRNLKNSQVEIVQDSFKERFDLCEDTYKQCNNGDCIEKQLKRTISLKQDMVYVELNLMRDCLKSTDFHTIIFKILCDNQFVNNKHFENESLKDCILIQIIRTHLICGFKTPATTTTTAVIVKEQDGEEIIKSNKSHYYYTTIENCLINDNNNQPILLNTLPGLSTTFSNSKYTVNFNQTIQNCYGLFCINDSVVVPFSINCPFVVRYNDEINLEFPSGTVCQDNLIYNVDMILKCNKEYSLKIRKNINCRIILDYNLPSICYQQQEINQNTTSTSGIIGGIIGGCITIIAILLLVYKLCRNCRNRPYFDMTTLSPFYLRDLGD